MPDTVANELISHTDESMPHSERAPRSARVVENERAAEGLRAYLSRIAAGFGVRLEASCCEVADDASAYLALPERVTGQPDQDAALVWNQRHGWALATEPNPGGALQPVAYHGPPLVPPPAAVLAFARRVLAHGLEPQPNAGSASSELASPEPAEHALGERELARQLAAYTEPSRPAQPERATPDRAPTEPIEPRPAPVGSGHALESGVAGSSGGR